jgi:hypothetical protein
MSVDLHCKAQTEDNVLEINLQKCCDWQFILLHSTNILIFVTVGFKNCPCARHERTWGSGGVPPVFLKLGIREMSVVSFIPGCFIPGGEVPCTD